MLVKQTLGLNFSCCSREVREQDENIQGFKIKSEIYIYIFY